MPSLAIIARVPRKKVDGPACIRLTAVEKRPPPLACCWIMISSIGPHTTPESAPG